MMRLKRWLALGMCLLLALCAVSALCEEQLRAQTDLTEFRRYLESKVSVVDVFAK